MSNDSTLKWLVIALAGSLCLNLAAVGFFIGRQAHDRSNDVLVTPQTIALQALPEERLQQLMVQLSESIDPVQQDMIRMRKVRGDLHRLLMSDPFNHEAFAHKLEELTASVARVHGHTNSSFVRITMHLTPNERRMVANMIERPRSLGPPAQFWVQRRVNERFDPGQLVEYELRLASRQSDR